MSNLPLSQQDLELNDMEMPHSPQVAIKEAQVKFLNGSKSILQNLQMPTLLVKLLFPGPHKAKSFAHIPSNQILNHFFCSWF